MNFFCELLCLNVFSFANLCCLDMFNALSHLSAPATPSGDTSIGQVAHVSKKDVFSIHVGPAGSKTDARFYIDSPADLVDAIAALV